MRRVCNSSRALKFPIQIGHINMVSRRRRQVPRLRYLIHVQRKRWTSAAAILDVEGVDGTASTCGLWGLFHGLVQSLNARDGLTPSARPCTSLGAKNAETTSRCTILVDTALRRRRGTRHCGSGGAQRRTRARTATLRMAILHQIRRQRRGALGLAVCRTVRRSPRRQEMGFGRRARVLEARVRQWFVVGVRASLRADARLLFPRRPAPLGPRRRRPAPRAYTAF